jgi:hypothetical protein
LPDTLAAPVRVTCQSRHPALQTATCGTLIGYLPGPLRFAGLVERAPAAPDGHVYVRCPRKTCGAWNRFTVLEPGDE